MIFIWGYTRLFFLAVFLKVTCYDEIDDVAMPNKAIYSMGFMLGFIFILNFYWFIMFFQMLYAFIVKGKVEDIQNKVGNGKKK